MSEIEFVPNWIYTVLILPIIVLFQKHFSIKSRVVKLETTQDFYTKKVDDVCESNAKLSEKVHEMLGRLDANLGKDP